MSEYENESEYDRRADNERLRQAQRAIWCGENDFDAPTRLVAVYLITMMDGDYDNASLSMAEIAAGTSYARETVLSACKTLIESGLFERRLTPGGRGAYTYSLNHQELEYHTAHATALEATRAEGGCDAQ